MAQENWRNCAHKMLVKLTPMCTSKANFKPTNAFNLGRSCITVCVFLMSLLNFYLHKQQLTSFLFHPSSCHIRIKKLCSRIFKWYERLEVTMEINEAYIVTIFKTIKRHSLSNNYRLLLFRIRVKVCLHVFMGKISFI